VGNGNAKLHGGQRNSDGGIDIADDENEIGLVIEKNGLDTLEDFGSLNSMSAGAHFKIDLRRGNAHLAEEDVGEGFVVVLASVDEDRFDLRVALHFAHERSNLGEIGTGAYDVDDFQLAGHEFVKVSENRSIAFGFRPFRAPERPFAPKKH